MLHSTALTETLLYRQADGRLYQELTDLHPDSPHAAAFSYARPDVQAAQQTMFDWLGAPTGDRAHRLARFGEGMRGMSALEPGSVLNG